MKPSVVQNSLCSPDWFKTHDPPSSISLSVRIIVCHCVLVSDSDFTLYHFQSPCYTMNQNFIVFIAE